MNGNQLSSTYGADVTFSYWKWMLCGLHYNIITKYSFHGLIYQWFYDKIYEDNHKTVMQGSRWYIPSTCPSLERWQLLHPVLLLILSQQRNGVAILITILQMSSLNSENEGQKQSPQDKKLGLSETAYPSKGMGWKEAFNTYLGKGTRKRGGRNIEAQHRFTNSLHCATTMYCCVLSLEPLSHGVKWCPQSLGTT